VINPDIAENPKRRKAMKGILWFLCFLSNNLFIVCLQCLFVLLFETRKQIVRAIVGCFILM